MSDNNIQALMFCVFGLFLMIALFLFFREIVCWYLKINNRLKLRLKTLKSLQEIKDLHPVINGNLIRNNGNPATTPKKPLAPDIPSLALKDASGRFITPES